MKSMGDIVVEVAINQQELGQYIGDKAGVLANLLSGSNGRDKICALVQYSAQLYTSCMRHSSDE